MTDAVLISDTRRGDARVAREGERSAILFLLAVACVATIVTTYERDVELVRWPLEISGYPALRDFSNLWAGGIAAITGEYARLFDAQLHSQHIGSLLAIPPPKLMWSYPPTAMMLAMPFALLPYAAACAVWTALGLALYVWAAGGLGSNRVADAARLAAIAFCPGVFLCAAYGQTAFFTSAVLLFGVRFANERPIAAGAMLALLAAKPHVALTVPVILLALGAWRAIAATAFFAAVFLALTVAILGLEPWHLFLSATVPQQMRIMSEGIYTVCMLISPMTFTRALGASVPAAYAAQAIVSLAAIVWLFLAVRAEEDENIRFAMIAAAVLLVSPYLQVYEQPLLVLAVVRIVASDASAARLGGVAVKALVASITIIPFVVLSVLMRSDVNFFCLIPGGVLVALGARSIFGRAAGRQVGATMPRRATAG